MSDDERGKKDTREKSDILQEIEGFFRVHRNLYGTSLPVDRELRNDLPAGAGTPAQHQPVAAGGGDLDTFKAAISNCQKCSLGATRTKFVFGVGNPRADLMLVGEAPGRDEDLQGEPFVGRAGQLLTLMLKAIGMKREDVFIANVLKCRPPDNRDPLPDEIEKCEPYLLKQIEMIQPKLLVALGRFASASLLRSKLALGKLRSEVHDYNGVPLIVTYHPAALLRNPQLKKQAWEDLKQIRGHIR